MLVKKDPDGKETREKILNSVAQYEFMKDALQLFELQERQRESDFVMMYFFGVLLCITNANIYAVAKGYTGHFAFQTLWFISAMVWIWFTIKQIRKLNKKDKELLKDLRKNHDRRKI